MSTSPSLVSIWGGPVATHVPTKGKHRGRQELTYVDVRICVRQLVNSGKRFVVTAGAITSPQVAFTVGANPVYAFRIYLALCYLVGVGRVDADAGRYLVEAFTASPPSEGARRWAARAFDLEFTKIVRTVDTAPSPIRKHASNR